MPTFEVEIETRGREVYSVEAPDADTAREAWDTGTLVLSEVTSVEDVTKVTEEEG